MELEGKTAIVTGASRGIGAAIARRLAAEGAHVAVNYSHSPDAAEAVVKDIHSKGGQAFAVQADMSSRDGARELCAATDDTFDKRLDILVSNAGYFAVGELADCTDEDFENTVNLNVRGVFLGAREAVTRMHSGGRIINIGSIFGERMPLPGVGLYTMSKFAVAGFTRAWARDLGSKGITVNCIQPGPIDTDLNPADGEFAPAITPLTALNRYGNTDEVADLVAFVASPRASYMTGACINVDGGVNA